MTSATDTTTTKAKTTSTSEPASASQASSTQPQNTVKQVQHIAELAILVPVGAGLVVRDDINRLAVRYGTRAGLERELKRYEKRGSVVRNRLERRVRKQRRGLERAVRQNRRRVERDIQSVRKDLGKRTDTVSTRVEKLVSNAQELIGSRA